MKMHFMLLALVMYLLPDGYYSQTGTTLVTYHFGFCHDSVNSERVI